MKTIDDSAKKRQAASEKERDHEGGKLVATGTPPCHIMYLELGPPPKNKGYRSVKWRGLSSEKKEKHARERGIKSEGLSR